MKELHSENCLHVLKQDDTNRLLLEVECGTTAVFTLTIELNEKERQIFERQGAPYVSALAWRIHDDPESYLERRVN
jgi:hypothetical protein